MARHGSWVDRPAPPHLKVAGSTTLRIRATIKRLGIISMSAILEKAAEYVREQSWMEGARPDLYLMLMASLGTCLDDRVDRLKCDGWDNRRHSASGVYLPRSDTSKFRSEIAHNPTARRRFNRLLDYLVEACGSEDLMAWSELVSTGAEDVIEAFERASALARLQGE